MPTGSNVVAAKGMPAGMVDMLDRYITDSSLKPGDRLPSIRELAAKFGLKPGSVRDTLMEAQAKGIVKVLPRSGTFVAQAADDLVGDSAGNRLGSRLRQLFAAQDHNLFHLLDVREVLEREAIALAASKRELQDLFPLRQILEEMASIPPEDREEKYTQLDVEFHLEIARLSGNASLAVILRTLLEELVPYLPKVSWSAERHRKTDASHSRLYSALVDGDVDLAKSEIRTHLQVAYNVLLEELREPPELQGSVA